jgi:competence protein ComFA
VVVEILPRVRAAFTVPICALYGDSPEEYHYTQFVIATTHQLLRFKAAFDLIVVDEVDAFPFAENAMLAGALSRALRPQGVVSYLTATPSQRLQKQVRNGQLKQSVLSRRYHGHPLPNFRLKVVRGWRARLPNLLINLCRDYRRSGQPFLVFVPEVADLINVRAQLVAKVPGLMIGTTHATAVDRQESVKKMRQGELQGLVTTTILERGVTFPGIDVVILGADEHVFSQSALVQIAGRCGRSQARPTGLVLAIVTEKTRVLMRARAEIDYLNKLRTADDV